MQTDLVQNQKIEVSVLGYIEKNLVEGEEIITVIHLPFIDYLDLILICSVLLLLFYYLKPILVVIPIIGLLWGIWFNSTYEYVVTNQRIIKKYGIISLNSSEIELDGLESLTVSQSSLGRMLGYGNVIANGTGSTIVFEHVSNPYVFRKQILELKHI